MVAVSLMTDEKLPIYKVQPHTVKVSRKSTPANLVSYIMQMLDSNSFDEFVELITMGSAAHYIAAKTITLLTYRIESQTPGVEVVFRLKRVGTLIKDEENRDIETVATLWMMKVQKKEMSVS